MSFFGIFEDTRSLTEAEKILARKVYQTYLPYDDILIGNKTGGGGAPFTEHSYNTDQDIHTYILHMGTSSYPDATSTGDMPGFGPIHVVFIHELCHVWQGHHSVARGGYMAASLWAQAKAYVKTGDRNNAYKYTAGEDWGTYNVEQQASIVEDWYAAGMKTDDARYRYIRDNIRK